MPMIRLDGLDLFYQERGNVESREVLMVLHAASAQGDYMGWALPRTQPFRILLPDQRGHGKTPNPAPNFHMPRLVDDILNLVDALDIDQFHGVGYSMGGGVLLGIAQTTPERLKSLAIIGATHHAPTPEQLTALAGPLEQRRGLVLETTHPERGVRVGWEVQPEKLRSLNIPVALIGGDREQVHPPENFVELYHLLPNAQLLIAPQCNHLEYHTHPFVKTFLQQHYEQILR